MPLVARELGSRAPLGVSAEVLLSSSSASSSLRSTSTSIFTPVHALDGGGGPNVPPSQGAVFALALSRVVGWTYFLCWVVSFIPQTVLNHKRRSVSGFSLDFLYLNILGFACYAAFNFAFLLSPRVREEYRERHQGNDNVAQWNDLAFAVWAFLLSLVQLVQVFAYKRAPGQRVSTFNRVVILVLLLVILVGFLLVTADQENHLQALDYVLLLSYIKLYVTLTKFIPQVHMNYRRRSTVGFSIDNIILDAAGGTLSLAQLFLDAGLSKDWSAVTGDFPKLALSLISLSYDAVLCVQHFILYKDNRDDAQAQEENDEQESSTQGRTPSERTPLLADE